MRLGLITDIHEQVEHLRSALRVFREERVQQIVVIGDVFRLGQRIEETCRLLAESNAIGVWGNHDFGLCFQPSTDICQRFPSSVIEFMTSLRPRLEVEGCYFSHVEPWLNPEEVADLWYFEGPPDRQESLNRIFNAIPNRLMFSGHYHEWMAVTPDAFIDWSGESSIQLESGRYFIVVGALCEGQFAVLDTGTSILTPFGLK